jgi:hypothetical protein
LFFCESASKEEVVLQKSEWLVKEVLMECGRGCRGILAEKVGTENGCATMALFRLLLATVWLLQTNNTTPRVPIMKLCDVNIKRKIDKTIKDLRLDDIEPDAVDG